MIKNRDQKDHLPIFYRLLVVSGQWTFSVFSVFLLLFLEQENSQAGSVPVVTFIPALMTHFLDPVHTQKISLYTIHYSNILILLFYRH